MWDAVTARAANVDELSVTILPTGDLDEEMAEEVFGVNDAGIGRRVGRRRLRRIVKTWRVGNSCPRRNCSPRMVWTVSSGIKAGAIAS